MAASRYQQIQALLKQNGTLNYATLRELLRIAIPYELRRRGVRLVRGRFGLRRLSDAVRPTPPRPFASSATATQKMVSRQRGDFYEAVTLLPHLPAAQTQAILAQPVTPTRRIKPDVICFSIIDWSFRFQRPQQLMTQFAAAGHRVFYINISQFCDRRHPAGFALEPLAERIFDLRVQADYGLDIASRPVSGRDADSVLRSLDALRRECDINEAIGYVMLPAWAEVARAAQTRWDWQIIYDCMDEWENFPRVDRALIRAEQALARVCDLLVVTAQRLMEKWSQYGDKLVLARNATDYDFYAARCRPNELLTELSHPIIGYFGALADWFDVELLAEVAASRPNYQFVLLGGIFDLDVSRLRALPNVKLLGQQPYETMPQYLYHFDACIIPFKLNPITEATDPVKLYEYLSGGKPVVSVRLPELEPYRGYVYLADSPAEFAEQLDRALAEDSAEEAARRRQLAQAHTWRARYEAITAASAQVAAAQHPRASIIIVTYNNLALTKLCLESLLRNTDYPNYEVIVVDNLSTDGTPSYLKEWAASYSNVKVLLNETNFGFAKANNQGIELATGEHLVLLNNDTVVPPGWLTRLLWHLRDERVGMVGPMTNFVGNEAKLAVDYQTWAEMEEFAAARVWQHEHQIADIHMLAMFCVALRRTVYSRVGPLDERFGIGMFEDDDYSVRVKQLGLRTICAADAFVHHFGQAAFGKLIRSGNYDALFNENRRQYEEKWGLEWVPHRNVELQFHPHEIA